MSNKPAGIFYIDPVDSATLRADLAAARREQDALRDRLESAEKERDEATDGYASLTRRVNEQAAELHQLRFDHGARTEELLKALAALGAAGEEPTNG